MFIKLKASLSPLPRADDGDKETTRRRRRLSKPLTNKASVNLLMLSAQQLDGQTNNSSDLDISPTSLSILSSQGNLREVIQAPVSESKPHILRTSAPIPGQEHWKSATFIVSKNPLESVDSSTLLSPKGSLKANRPLSAIFTVSNSRRASNSAQRRASLKALAALAENGPDKAEKTGSATTALCSSERQSEALSPRIHRRSSFTPGVATRISRKPSWGPPPVGEQDSADHNHYQNPTSSEESPQSQLGLLDFDEEWAPPPPPVTRSETPSDLDYTHLGGLRLGSLQVMNGRASPAPSELSRHLTGASTPNLKRGASSNYGDAEDRTVVTLASLRQKSYRGRDQGLQDVTAVPRKPVAAPPRSQTDGLILPKRNKRGLRASSNRAEATSVWMPASKIDPPLSQPASSSLDKTSELAMAYMAELSASPYSGERSTSPAGSVLKSTSKATEFDDDLFEDDAADLSSSYEMDYQTPDTHPASSDPVLVYDDAYRLSVKQSRKSSSRPSLQPSNSTGSSVKPDSGYGSNISLQSLKGQADEASGKPEMAVPNKNAAQAKAMDIEKFRGRPGAGPSPKPSRPSILKRHSSTALQVPDFSNLYPPTTSTTTLAAITSTNSAPSAAPVKHRKLQKKARPQSQPPPVRQIVIQGQHRDFSNGDVPPPPTEIVANLAIRSQQVPELGHTFSSTHHTREIENSPKPAYIPTFVNFPQTDGSRNDLLSEVNLPTPPSHRASLIKWSKTERRNGLVCASGAGGISEDDAMAIIRNLDTAGSSMGGSPYDVASKTTKSVASQPLQSKTPNDFHTRHQNQSQSRPMMDDATAAELARLRSRTIAERDNMQWKQRRSSFNDRGGIPGRNIRPMSTAGDAPPLPALPSHEKVRQREFQKVDYQRPYLETRTAEKKYRPEQVSYDPYESIAPPPPSHSPGLRTIELEGDMPPPPPSHSPRPRSLNIPEDANGPPPPSHSPRPRPIRSYQEVSMPRLPSHSPHPISFGPQAEAAGIWAAQASAWKSRRKSIGEILRSRTFAPDEQDSTRPFAVEESVIDDPIYPEIPLRRPQKSFTTGPEEYGRSDMQFSSAHPEPIMYKLTGRPGPSDGSFVGKTINLAHSRLSQGPGHTSSHLVPAEESHMPQDQRAQPPPQFGRYSGGLDYGYKHELGFSGSAGTRSVSGVAKATRKGVPLSEGFGVDLSDAPIMATIRRKPVGNAERLIRYGLE
jgi:hypothetical protein